MSEDNSNSSIPSTTEIIQKSQQNNNNNNNTSLPIDAPLPEVTSPSQQLTTKPNEIEKSTIEWVSQDSCGGCKQQDEFFNNTLKPQRDVPTEIIKIDINSDRGQQIADENNLKYVPFAKECLIFKDKTKQPECKTYNSYDPKNWKIKLNDNNTTPT